ncbi:hypothetical protein UFOVP330_26 [uncultured Caudovirales phage]|jgi:hypothetical protein|uniref:Uncharacterized protein n=1 Tax=uncultured Caudovirales phage TaxID=2100421 RepID=A0A6J5LVA8_9CAUD|nr:hypothetical protein UFOVP330_26 [uncultured Caudovirales phage]
MTTAVANKTNTAVSTDVLDDIFETAGDGAHFDSSEMQIPFIRVLQALSPQLNKNKPEFIKGASNGDIYNTVTGEFWAGEQGITVIPVYQETKYLEFVPRSQGGGYKGERHPSDPDLQNTSRDGSKEILPNGNELVKSDQHFCLVLADDGSYQPAIIDMKSTSLKVSRRWKTQIAMQKVKAPDGRMLTPALYATMWKLSAVEESNDQGSWYNWSVEKVGLVQSKELFQEAKSMRESVASGAVKAAADPDNQSSARGSSRRQDDSEIPF